MSNKWLAVIASVGVVIGLLAWSTYTPPIKTTFRQSALDSSGLVLQVHNTGAGHLACKMFVKNKTSGSKADYVFHVSPYAMEEIGILEAGWSFNTGERVRIKTEGYWDITLSVP